MVSKTIEYLLFAAFVCMLFAAIASANDTRIYDKHEGYVGRIDDDGSIYDRHEGYVGRIDGGCND